MCIYRQVTNKGDRFVYVSRADLKAKTESVLIAGKDHAQQTTYEV
jgi:hypothetical protein